MGIGEESPATLERRRRMAEMEGQTGEGFKKDYKLPRVDPTQIAPRGFTMPTGDPTGQQDESFGRRAVKEELKQGPPRAAQGGAPAAIPEKRMAEMLKDFVPAPEQAPKAAWAPPLTERSAGDPREATYLPDPSQRSIDPVGPGFVRNPTLVNNVWQPPPGGYSTEDNPRWHQGTPAWIAEQQQFINRGQVRGQPTTRGQATAAPPGSPLEKALQEYYRDPAQEAVNKRAELVKMAQSLPPEQQAEAAKKIAELEIPQSPFQGRTVMTPAGPATSAITTIRGGSDVGTVNFYNQQQIADQQRRGINLGMIGSGFEWNKESMAQFDKAIADRLEAQAKSTHLAQTGQAAMTEAQAKKTEAEALAAHEKNAMRDFAVKTDPNVIKTPEFKKKYDLPMTQQEKLQENLKQETGTTITPMQALKSTLPFKTLLEGPMGEQLKAMFENLRQGYSHDDWWLTKLPQGIDPSMDEQAKIARGIARAPEEDRAALQRLVNEMKQSQQK